LSASSTPVAIAESARAAFAGLLRDFKARGDYTRLQNDLDRWKRRTAELLSGVVPAPDLEAFQRLSLRLDWSSFGDDDPLAPVIDQHEGYFGSLIDDMRKYPQSYGEGVVRSPKGQAPRTVATRPGPILALAPVAPQVKTSGAVPSLKLPEPVTLSWLVQHVPVRFWLYLLGLLAAAFGLGVRLARYVGPLIGIELP